jgi:hypothetical protein
MYLGQHEAENKEQHVENVAKNEKHHVQNSVENEEQGVCEAEDPDNHDIGKHSKCISSGIGCDICF